MDIARRWAPERTVQGTPLLTHAIPAEIAPTAPHPGGSARASAFKWRSDERSIKFDGFPRQQALSRTAAVVTELGSAQTTAVSNRHLLKLLTDVLCSRTSTVTGRQTSSGVEDVDCSLARLSQGV